MTKSDSDVDLDALASVPVGIDVSDAISLGTDILGRASRTGTAELRLATRILKRDLRALQLLDREATVADATSKRKEQSAARVAADHRLDRLWSAAESRLMNWEAVDAAFASDKESAATLHAMLFPTGLEWLNGPYRSEWAESDQRVQLVRENNHEETLRALISDAFVTSLFNAHEAYGKALGIGEAGEPEKPTASLTEALNDLRGSLKKYARLLVALTDERDTDAVAATAHALAPLGEMRATLAASSARKKAAEAKNEEPAKPE